MWKSTQKGPCGGAIFKAEGYRETLAWGRKRIEAVLWENFHSSLFPSLGVDVRDRP